MPIEMILIGTLTVLGGLLVWQIRMYIRDEKRAQLMRRLQEASR